MPRLKNIVYCKICKNIIPFVFGKKRMKYCISCRKLSKKKYVSHANGKTCDICQKNLLGQQKVFCSTTCQALGASKRQYQPRKEKLCLFCKNVFLYLSTSNNKSLYCSRICKDKHQKIKYEGSGNPCWNRKVSHKERKKRSSIMKEKWSTDQEFRKSIKRGQLLFMSASGYWPGTDPQSTEKRNKTLLTRYGVTHAWKSPVIREKCEKTCLKLYGKHSWEIAMANLPKNGTRIERKIANILLEHNINFEQQFRIYTEGRKYKQYDFFLPQYNILIEADGDYWHGNPNIFSSFDKIQSKNHKNDIYKNTLAIKKGYQIKRFWETDIHKKDFESVFLITLTRDEI